MKQLLVPVQLPPTYLHTSLEQNLFLLGNGYKKHKAQLKVCMGIRIQLQSNHYYSSNEPNEQQNTNSNKHRQPNLQRKK